MVVEADGPECPGTLPQPRLPRGALLAARRSSAARRAGHGPRGRRTAARAAATPRRRRHLDRLGRYLGIGISNMVNTFQPEHVVIGGGLSARGRPLPRDGDRRGRARARCRRCGSARPCRSRQAGNDAGVIGAGLLALQEHSRAVRYSARPERDKGEDVLETATAQDLDQLCVNTIRTLSMDAVQKANSGHPGTPMALAPITYVLYTRVMKHNPDEPGLVRPRPLRALARATPRCCSTRCSTSPATGSSSTT